MFFRRGGAPGENSGLRQQRAKKRDGIHQVNPLAFQHLCNSADQGVRVSRGEAGKQLHHFEVRQDPAEDLLVLDLTGHDRAVDTFGLEGFDEFSKLAERQPVHGLRVLLNFRKRFFLDGGNDDVEALGACGVQHQ